VTHSVYTRRLGLSLEGRYPLGRHVHHDTRSLAFPYRTEHLPLVSAKHQRQVPVFDQGQTGSCTGNAAVGALGTDPLFGALTDTVRNQLNEATAISVYSEATALDPFPGAYPPTDTGSDGTSIAKVTKSRGWISGYEHAFSLDAALKALGVTPIIVGTNWYESMFDPAPDGHVSIAPGSKVAGGHEYVIDQINVDKEICWATNSWGLGFGAQGRFYLTFATLERLLREDGDATVLLPATVPAPTPVPVDPDRVLYAAQRAWAQAKQFA